MSVLVALFFNATFPRPVCAVTLKDMPVSGLEHVDDVEGVDAIIKDIPESVMELYRQKGGKITIVPYRLDRMAQRYGVYETGVTGLYIFKGCRIYVSSGDSVTVGYCLAHEIGHFLYNETRPSWSEKAKLRFTDDETFARMYGAHYTFHNQFPGDVKLFSEIEKVAEKLVEK